jgi:hypothetical protein
MKIVLPVLYEWVNWFLLRKEEYRMKVLEKKVQRKLLLPNRAEGRGGQ